jgi:ribosomal protein S25
MIQAIELNKNKKSDLKTEQHQQNPKNWRKASKKLCQKKLRKIENKSICQIRTEYQVIKNKLHSNGSKAFYTVF